MRVIRLVFILAAAFLPVRAWAGPVVVGSEFQVNTYTTGDQQHAAVATNGAGAFVVVWESDGQDGSGKGIFRRRFDESGLPVGGEFQVNTFTTGEQAFPSVAMEGSGTFLVAWRSGDQDGSGLGIFGRFFDETGTAWGGDFQINTYTTGDQFTPKIVSKESGDFVVVWGGFGQDGSGFGNQGQRFDPDGGRVGGEFLINTFTPSWQSNNAIDMNENGEFVVAWRSWGQDGSGYGVFGQRFDSDALREGGEFQVNLYTTGSQYGPAVGMDDQGRFLVLWESPGEDLSGQGVIVRYFDSEGQGGIEAVMNVYTADHQRRPAISMTRLDNFLAVWDSAGQDGSGRGVYAQNWESPDPEYRVNTYTAGDQDEPAVAVSDSGNMMVVWRSGGQDGSGSGVFAQRYACHDMDADGLCNFADVMLMEPHSGEWLDCADPKTWQPTIEWKPGDYDRFRVYLSANSVFSKGMVVSSGDTMMKGTSWTPPKKKWKKVCQKALSFDPREPAVFVHVLGVDKHVRKKDPNRKTYSQMTYANLQY